ncbi:50S ribosomal protein L13 [Erwinia rhapontici]|nr:50S ribosomal protein L13 [Erwinia rhapontici]
MSTSASERLPRKFQRVWVKTDSGKETTAYVNAAGEWRINCPRIAAENPTVVSWRE